VHPTRRQWRMIYAVTAFACAAIILTAGSNRDSGVWHAGVVIMIAGSLILWRLSEP
jgi:hypothetical protein